MTGITALLAQGQDAGKSLYSSRPYRYGVVVMGGLLILAVAPSVFAEGQLDAARIREISANWQCQWCPYDDNAASQGEIEAGAGYVSNDSYKHGDYTGLEKKGAYAIGNLEHTYRGPRGRYSDVEVSDLGLDSRQVRVQGGMQGSATAQFNYSELPKLNSDTARTPYSGSSRLQLPAGWTPQADTQSMTQLASALHDVNVMTERRSYAVSGTYHQTPRLSYGLTLQRDTKQGRKTAGLALGNSFAAARSAVLPIPVDYTTTLGEATINYVKSRWQGVVSYQFSNFENDNKSVNWDNAFSLPASVTQGQAALEPANSMQKISLRGNYRLYSKTRVTGLLAFGQMEQDELFLPYTINGGLSPGALPRSSLNGKINTFDTSVAIYSELTERFDLQAEIQQHEQDNDTPRATYSYVTADTSLSGNPRANFPYSFRQQRLQLEGNYRIAQQRRLAAGYELENMDRTYQEAETTRQHGVWGRYTAQAGDDLQFSLRLEKSNRDNENYQALSEIIPAENPLLRKYNLADRKRDKAAINVVYSPRNQLQLNIFTDYARDDYANSELGLQQSKQANYALGLQYQASEAVVFNADYTLTRIDSRQAGRMAATDWQATNEDSIDVAHLGVVYQLPVSELKLGADYAYALSTETILVSGGDGFPDLKSKRHTLTLYGDYPVNKRATLHVVYRYEDYSEQNWSIDGVVPNTIPRVLTLGDVSPDYSIGVFAVSVRYSLD